MTTSTPDERDDEASQNQPRDDQEEAEEKDGQTPEGADSDEEDGATEEPPRRTTGKRSDLFGIHEIGQGYPFNVKDTLGEAINSSTARMTEDINRSFPKASGWVLDLVNTQALLDSLTTKVSTELKLNDKLSQWALANDPPRPVLRQIKAHRRAATDAALRVEELQKQTEQQAEEGDTHAQPTEEFTQEVVEAERTVTGLTNLGEDISGIKQILEKNNQDTTAQWRVSTFVTVTALAVTALAISSNSVVGETAKVVSGWPWYVNGPAAAFALALAWTGIATWNSRHKRHEEERNPFLTFTVDTSSRLSTGAGGVLRKAWLLPRKSDTTDQPPAKEET